MTVIKEEQNKFDHQGGELSPGERLRRAREDAGLSCNEVASHLKLSVEKIASLEQGNVDQLAAPVFVAGYLRAYAKLVGLPENEIIADFKALSTMDAPSVDPSTSPASNNYGGVASSVGKNLYNRKDWSQMAVYGSIAMVLLVVVFVMFTGNESDTSGKLKKETVNAELANTSDNTVKPVADSNVSTADTEIISSEAIEQDASVTTTTEVLEQEIPVTSTNDMIEQEKSVVQQDVIPAQTESGDRKIPVPGAMSQETDRKDLKHSVIVFNFREDSWIEATDALGKRLLFRLAKAGTTKTVWGVAPINVQLGYVGGVDIIFNGEPYDLSRYANKRSVRVKLGESGDRMNNE